MTHSNCCASSTALTHWSTKPIAGQIFASSFEETSLIEEERLKPEEFFTVHTAFGDPEEGGLFALPLPGVADQALLDPANASSAESYIAQQAQLWLGDTRVSSSPCMISSGVLALSTW